jgi:geranylgeranyl reductase family protein
MMQTNKTYDALIIGAGPSGMNTARLLALRGMSVAVLERKNQIGDNIVCTGIVGEDIFSRFQIPSDSVINKIQKVNLFSPLDLKLSYFHPAPFAYVLDRKQFDLSLFREAAQKGAVIRTGFDVKDINICSRKVRVTGIMKQGQEVKINGRILVLATGNNFRLHKRLKLGQPREFLNAVQAELKTDEASNTEVWVGRNVAPGGFAWSVPLDKTRVRTGLFTKAPPIPYLDQFIKKRFPSEAEKIGSLEMRSKTIAQGVVSPTYGDRVLSVGEAAAQVKTTTGGGIYYGLICSEIAADVIIHNAADDRFAAADLADYEKRWRKTIHKELTVGLYTRKICSRLKDREVERLFQIARDDGVFPLIKDMARFDWQKDIILALAKKATVRSIQALPQLFS